MQSSHPALGDVHGFQEACKLPEGPKPREKKKKKKDAAVFCIALAPRGPAGNCTCCLALSRAPLQKWEVWSHRRGFCWIYFFFSFLLGVKYWWRFWGCGWLRHHGCEFRLIDTGCIDHEMHPQGWLSPVISQGYVVPSVNEYMGQLQQPCYCLGQGEVDALHCISGSLYPPLPVAEQRINSISHI